MKFYDVTVTVAAKDEREAKRTALECLQANSSSVCVSEKSGLAAYQLPPSISQTARNVLGNLFFLDWHTDKIYCQYEEVDFFNRVCDRLSISPILLT